MTGWPDIRNEYTAEEQNNSAYLQAVSVDLPAKSKISPEHGRNQALLELPDKSKTKSQYQATNRAIYR
jgi:hypothetical protein